MQTKIKVKELELKSSTENISSKFEEIKNKETTREVILVYKICCGCGCDYAQYKRVVPYDSPLKNGDVIHDIRRTDRYFKSGRYRG